MVSYAQVSSTKRQVAIKEICLTSLPEKEREQLLQEKHLLRSLNHKNIVNLLAVFEIPEFNFLIFDYCQGGDLFDKLSNEGL